MTILVIAGEISADIYAAALAKALKHTRPELTLYGIGGEKLEKESDHFLANIVHLSAVGIVERYVTKTPLKRQLSKLRRTLPTLSLSGAILVDFPHYNIELAAMLAEYNIPIITFITPNFWLWADKKHAQKLIGYSKSIITIFEKEHAFYSELTDKAVYFGHPLVEIMAPSPVPPETRSKSALIGLFPGSRRQEIKLLLRPMIEAAVELQKFRPDLRFELALASEKFRPLVEAILKKNNAQNISVCISEGERILRESRFIICGSGSVTLEAVLRNTPMVILGALSPVTYWIIRYLLKIRFDPITLPNIILGRHAIPEFIQHDIKTDNILSACSRLLTYDGLMEALHPYDEIKTSLGKTEKPVFNAATHILSVL